LVNSIQRATPIPEAWFQADGCREEWFLFAKLFLCHARSKKKRFVARYEIKKRPAGFNLPALKYSILF
jgi:hypothetical protein